MGPSHSTGGNFHVIIIKQDYFTHDKNYVFKTSLCATKTVKLISSAYSPKLKTFMKEQLYIGRQFEEQIPSSAQNTSNSSFDYFTNVYRLPVV